MHSAHARAHSRADAEADEPAGARRARRRSTRSTRPLTALFTVVVLGLVGFGAWAWLTRIHVDDLTAYTMLTTQISELDRDVLPLGHSEVPPCRDRPEGTVTRTYPASTGPQADELIGYLTQKGWVDAPASPPAVSHLSRTAGAHRLTATVFAASRSSLVTSLTATSPGSAAGCFLR